MCKPMALGGAGSAATFVHADSASFRGLVQHLTGPNHGRTPPAPKATQKHTLHERRRRNKAKIEIKRQPEIQHQPFQVLTIPTILYMGIPKGGYWAGPWSCPASPVSTPAVRSKKRASPSAVELVNVEEEERAIKEMRFYLHPSPRSRPWLAAEPELLPLFPLKAPPASASCER